jgi:NADPH2:quinone reductase
MNTSPTPTQPGHWLIPEFGPPSVLKWQPFNTLPEPGPNTARIRILVAGISGADNFMRVGGYQRDPRTQNPGFTPGYDLVGVIDKIGLTEDDMPYKVGSLIASMTVVGAYGTHVVLPIDELLKVEPDDDVTKVGTLPLNYMTAYGMLTRSAYPIDSSTKTILIGSVAGGVGTAVAQVARLLFPDITIFGTCSPSKFDFVKSLGVEPIDRTGGTPISEAVKKLNGGKGVDISYEATGSEENLNTWLDSTSDGGKVIAIGFMSTIAKDGAGLIPTKSPFDPVAFTLARSDRMSFFSVTNHYWRAHRDLFKSDFELLLQAVRTGDLNPVVGSLWQLKDAVEINERLVHGEGVAGKMEMLVDVETWERYGLLPV